MSYVAAPFNDFPGLDLVNSPDASGCLDALNVDLDVRGAVRSRDGFDNFNTSAVTGLRDVAGYRTTAGTVQVLVQKANALQAFDSAGASVATLSFGGASGGRTSFIRFGSPTAERVYIVSSTGTAIMARWDGTAFTSLSSVTITGSGASNSNAPNARLGAVQSNDNRLVVATSGSGSGGPGDVASSFSHVWFSTAGLPETWDTQDYVILTPGDGEKIRAVVAWGPTVFVFKESRFFVFYGNSVGTTGSPVFNYRTVESGVGCDIDGAAVATPQGVCFVNRRGIYLTTGGKPTLISSAVDPIFRDGASSFFQGGALNQTQITLCALTWHDERLYFAYPSGSATANDKMLVWDSRYDYWLLWDVAAAGLTSFTLTTRPELLFAYAAGTYVGRHSSAYTTDDGTAITSRYRTGFHDLGVPGVEKRIAEAVLWGTGSVTYALSRDFGALNTTSDAVNDVAPQQTVTLGTSPAIARGHAHVAGQGLTFSHQFSGTGAWRVYRHQYEISGERAPGMWS